MRLLSAVAALLPALAGLLLGLYPLAARAEADRDSAHLFTVQEGLRAGQPGQAPIAAQHRTAPTFRRILMQRATADPRAAVDRRPSHQAPAAAPSPTAGVAIFGDRFGQALAAGLQDGADAGMSVSAVTSDDSGLARPDFSDWLQSIRARLGKPDHPGVGIVMLGSNDRQPLPDGRATVDPSNARWPALYGARVDAVVSAFRDAHVPLIWVGLPSVHSEEISADFVRLNGIVRDRMAQHGETYVDSWEAFNDETGRYSPVGPDIEGDSVKLRKAEGFGFTRAGARKLASFVEGDLKRLQTAAPAGPAGATADITIETPRDFDQALQIDVNAQIRREAGLTPEAGPVLGGAAPQRPAAGPVIALTAPPLSPDGQLAGRTDAPASPATSLQDVAQAAAPKPGRADNFAWPKP